MGTQYSRREIYSSGDGKFIKEQVPTQSMDQLSWTNLSGKVEDASSEEVVLAGTVDQKAIITNYSITTAGTKDQVNSWFELGIAGGTARQDYVAGPDTESFTDTFSNGGLGVVPAGSAVAVKISPEGTVDASANLRMVPFE